MATINLPGLLQMLTEDYKSAQKKRETRYTEGMGVLENIVKMFGPGYLKGEEKQMLASMEQGMVGRGLGGTTRPAAVGTGIKADIRDRQTRARTGAMTNVANFMTGFQDIYPDPGTLAHLATGGFSAMGAAPPVISGTTFGPMAQQGLSATGSPLSGGGGGRTISGGGQAGTTSGGWQPSGLPSVTGAGAATYGISGGAGGWSPPREYDPSMVGQSMWAQQGSQVPGSNIPAQTTPGGMDEFQKTYTPQTGDVSLVSDKPVGGGGYAAWLQAQGKGATARTIMQWERAGRPNA